MAGPTIRLIVLPVDAQASAIVLNHAMDGLGIMDRSPKILVGFCAHLIGRNSVPSIRVSENSALRLCGLRKKEPVPPSLGEAGVAAFQRLKDRHSVEDGKTGDDVRVVHSCAERRIAAAIVPHES